MEMLKEEEASWARERECVCVWKGFKFSKKRNNIIFLKKKR